MKLSWLALLSLGTAALCQSPAQRPVNPDKLFQMPEGFPQQAPQSDKGKPPHFFWNKSIQPPRIIAPPRPMLDNPQIDPKFLIHPPWHKESRGRDLAHHLYPNLKFLP